MEPWVLETFEKLAKASPLANGRVLLGFAFDGWVLPKQTVIDLYQKVRSLGVRRITSHHVENNFISKHAVHVMNTANKTENSAVKILSNYGLLGPDILLSHATGISQEDAASLKAAGGHISSTPETEMQMSHGQSVCFRAGLQDVTSLGIDCHSVVSSSLPTQMRIALQHQRANWNQGIIEKTHFPKHVKHRVEQAFNLGTIQGARAVGLEDVIGSIEVGKLADIVIFDGKTPGMLAAAVEDPIAAIVMHSSIRDVDMVISDGQIRKQNGKLLPVTNASGESIEWETIANRVLESRLKLVSRSEKIDYAPVTEAMLKMFQAKDDLLVDN
jgi:cytosine/adenosine deaminase-related metal-dependent hydrolase